MKWIEAMWNELEQMTPLQRYVACSEWITVMQQDLVPRLAARRRDELVQAAEDEDRDYQYIAEAIGSRKATVERLVNEGRAAQRELAKHHPAA